VSDEEISLEVIKKEDIDKFWPSLVIWFAMACDKASTLLTVDEIYEHAKSGDWWCWVISKSPATTLGVAATNVHNNIAIVQVVAGVHSDEWIDIAMNKFEVLAKENGVEKIIIDGRLGWKRMLRNIGYKPVRIALEKVL